MAYIASGGHDTQVLFGALLELLLIIANIGTAVVIFPILRRQNEELALGYVTARLVECTFILVGILAMLGIITLAQQAAGANEGTVAYTLAAIKDWTFLLGPGWVVGWGNGLILGYLMYRSELVPRRACWLGLIGGPLIIITGTAVLFTGNDPSDALRSLQGDPDASPSSSGSSSSASTARSRASGRPRRSSATTLVRIASGPSRCPHKRLSSDEKRWGVLPGTPIGPSGRPGARASCSEGQ